MHPSRAGPLAVRGRDGFRVTVVQNPTLSLDADAEVTRRALDRQDGPAVLVGHSYGGAVISEAGTHEKVARSGLCGRFRPREGRVRSDTDVRSGAGRPGSA